MASSRWLSIASCRPLALAAALLCQRAARGQDDVVTPTDPTEGGYIDSAYVGDMIRFRVDAGFNNDTPDRAEFFYAKCGCFRPVDPNAPGPPLPESSLDYQVLQADVQFLLTENLAVFLETPVRFVAAEQNLDAGGISDLQAGFKYALWACPDSALTFQFRTYLPTGNASLGLGTDHVSLEPALLFHRQLPENWVLEGEFRDWIPIGGSSSLGTGLESKTPSFTANILRYGLGIGYNIEVGCKRRITPIAEFVGWTLLGGISDRLDGTNVVVRDETGTTIVNAKIGVRLSNDCGESLYAGYGRALTDEVWYSDMVRLEYRREF